MALISGRVAMAGHFRELVETKRVVVIVSGINLSKPLSHGSRFGFAVGPVIPLKIGEGAASTDLEVVVAFPSFRARMGVIVEVPAVQVAAHNRACLSGPDSVPPVDAPAGR